MLKRFVRTFREMLDNASGALKRAAAPVAADEIPTEDGCSAQKIQRKPKKVKYAMLLAYQGQNYFGMQLQRSQEFPTVEGHLLDAMEAHGFIIKDQRVDLMDWQFQRAARTDRSVSAARQMCSMHLPLDQNFIENGPSLLNSSLPEDIRVFGIRRVTPSFHSQKFCDGRTYSYTLPTFAFAPVDELTNDEYRISPARVAEIRELLSCFEGSHNFFNYTSGLEHSDQRSRRTIISMTAKDPFIYMDSVRERPVEFLRIEVRGQSFMLHQIRKMIGVVLAILRGFMYKSDITRSFQPGRMDIPRAPGLGLLLENLHYDRFEKRYLQTHGSLNDWGEKVEMELQTWRDQHIIERILCEECRTQTMMKWLSTLSIHGYIADPEDETGEKSLSSGLREAARNAVSSMDPSDPVTIQLRKEGLFGGTATEVVGGENEVVSSVVNEEDGDEKEEQQKEHSGEIGEDGDEEEEQQLLERRKAASN